MIVGNDEKVTWDDTGKMMLGPPGWDTVSLMTLSDGETPRTVATLPVPNTVIGPPVNLAIAPNERLALVANSMKWRLVDKAWKNEPDNKVSVIDLTTSPPSIIATVEVGRQPAGIDINRAGDLALVANRADKSISVLSIHGREVKVTDTVAIKEDVAAVVFTPNGERALVVKQAEHKVAVLNVFDGKVTYHGLDVAVGMWPYNIVVAPNGKLALTADLGNKGGSDGIFDTVSVIDLEQSPPKVSHRVDVGDGPEGLAMSPTGKLAAVAVLRGSSARALPYYHRNGSIIALKIDGKTVSRGNEIEVGALPEGLVFSSNGKYLYVGNFIDGDLSILRVEGTTLVDTGKRLKLPGHPAAMR